MDILETEYIENFIYLDIETIPLVEPDMDELRTQVPKSYKTDKAINNWLEEKYEKEIKARSVDSTKGRLCSVAFALNEEAEDTKSISVVKYQEDEAEMVKEFWHRLKEKIGRDLATAGWVGHNLPAFDMPWLLQRFIKYGYPIHELPSKPFDKRLIDTGREFAFTDRHGYYSLQAVCEFLGIETKDDLDGSKVYEYFKAGKLDETDLYNKKDVYRVKQIHNKIRG